MISKKISLVLVAFIFCVSGFAYAGDVQLTSDGKVPGKPFQELQQQVDVLKQQITDLQQVGVIGHNTYLQYEEVTVASGDYTFICAAAPFGKHVVGGGGIAQLGEDDLTMVGSYPSDGNCTTADYSFSMDFWCVYWKNNTGQTWSGTISAYIISIGEEYTGQYYGCN